jgi:hypothetical protein
MSLVRVKLSYVVEMPEGTGLRDFHAHDINGLIIDGLRAHVPLAVAVMGGARLSMKVVRQPKKKR